MTRLATPLVVVIAAAVLLYFGGVGGNSSSAGAQYRRYFDQGRRACAALRAGVKPTPFGGVNSSTQGSGSLDNTITVQLRPLPPRKLSSPAQRAFRAGCNAVS